MSWRWCNPILFLRNFFRVLVIYFLDLQFKLHDFDCSVSVIVVEIWQDFDYYDIKYRVDLLGEIIISTLLRKHCYRVQRNFDRANRLIQLFKILILCASLVIVWSLRGNFHYLNGLWVGLCALVSKISHLNCMVRCLIIYAFLTTDNFERMTESCEEPETQQTRPKETKNAMSISSSMNGDKCGERIFEIQSNSAAHANFIEYQRVHLCFHGSQSSANPLPPYFLRPAW